MVKQNLYVFCKYFLLNRCNLVTEYNFGTVMLYHKCVLLNRLKCEPDSDIVIKYLVE